MKAISLWQPWASAIALGLKAIETRGKRTHYRGPIAIHAAKTDTEEVQADFARLMLGDWRNFRTFKAAGISCWEDVPRGCVVATAELVDCVSTEDLLRLGRVTPLEYEWGNYAACRFGYVLANVKRLEKPIPARGAQYLFDWEEPKS